MDSSEVAWVVVGTLMTCVGVGLALSPRFADRFLSLSYREEMATRYPRFYGLLGWSWLLRRPKMMRTFTALVGWGWAGVGIGIVVVTLAR
jgi:hypothetical protein